MTTAIPFSSGDYWEVRYRDGGTSGAGSVGRLAAFKAATINGFVAANAIRSVIDLGCGDASQLALLELPADYVGVDVSPSSLARCAARFPDRRFLTLDELRTVSQRGNAVRPTADQSRPRNFTTASVRDWTWSFS